MAEKFSEATWTAFSKKQKLDLRDAPLVKALAKFDKTSEDKPEPRLEALQGLIEEIKKQVTAQAKRKKEMGDKVFGEVKDKLYALLDSAEMLHKDTERAVEARKASADDEEESPALLTTRLIPLLRELRKGDVEMQALIALAGKETVVLLSRKAISPARGKLLKDQMTNPSGLKFIRGTCLLEQGSITFVVQGPAVGLAKKIKAALLQQTEQRLKVRVRGEDPNDVDEEGEDNESTAEGSTIPQAPPLRTAGAAQPQAAAGATDPAAAAFKARLSALVPKVKTAAPEVRAKVSEAGLVARQNHDFEGAHALLDEAERMLEAGLAVAAGTAPAGGGDRSPAMAQWTVDRTAALATLRSVAEKIAAAKHARSGKAILEIQSVIKNLTPEPSTMQQITALQNWLGSDDVVNDVCELAKDFRTPLLKALTGLRAQAS